MFFFQNGVSVQNNFIPFNGNHFSGVFVNKVFNPGFEYAGCKLPAQAFLQTGFCDFDFIGQAKDFQNVFVTFKPYGPEQRGDRQFFLSVNVSVHHVVDVCCKFNPGTFERDDSCRIQFCSVCVYALSKKYSGRPV